MRRGGAWAALVAGCCSLGFAAAAAKQAGGASRDAAPASPYLIDHSPLDLAQRARRHEALARSAAADADRPRQARHAALACYWRSLLTLDRALTAPSCAEAARLAAGAPAPDVPLMLDAARAECALWVTDVEPAAALLAGILARGQALDPAAPEAHPLRLARVLRGVALTEAGRFGEAAAELSRARSEARSAGDLELLARGELYDCLNGVISGDQAGAQAACARTGALVADGDFYTELNLAYIDGLRRMSLGDLEGALAGFRRTLALGERPGGQLRTPTARVSSVLILLRLHRLTEARDALEAIDRELAAGRFPTAWQPLVELRWGLLELESRRPAEAGRHFAASARSQEHFMSIWGLRGLAEAQRQLADYAGARATLEEALRRTELERSSMGSAASRADFAESHMAVYRELVGVRWDAEGPAAAAAALELAEAGMARSLLDVLAQAQAIGATAPTLTAAGVQERLAPGEVLVEYVSSKDRLLAITVTGERIDLRLLPGAGSAEQLAERVGYFAALVQEGDEAALEPAARRLYQDLLEPALAGIGPGSRTLIIAADGPLHRLPFDALGGSPRVIDRWDVVLIPSASVLAAHASGARPPAAALIVSAPAAALPALAAAPAEAAALRRRVGGEVDELSGADATVERLVSSGLDRYAVLHFASHAVVDEEEPLRSSLQLAPQPGHPDGRWRAADIYRARLAADLVVLSACGTAGGAIAGGEGVMSLARAFLHAGARATIATLWDLPDAPAPAFADVLYRELAAGRPLGAAAALARRELRGQGAPPRAWAGWVVSGAPGARVGVAARSPWASGGLRLRLGLALAALLAAAALGVLLSDRPGRLPRPGQPPPAAGA